MNSNKPFKNRTAKDAMYRLGLYTPRLTAAQLNKLTDYAETLIQETPDKKRKIAGMISCDQLEYTSGYIRHIL